jgi:hydroxyacid-oxoacid transhydrogenase
MMKEARLPNGISGVGYTEADLPGLTERAWAQQRLIVNAPLELSEPDLSDLFRNAMRYW